MVRLAILVVCVGAFSRSGSTAPAKVASPQPDPSLCCGTERASLGALFKGITLGQTTQPALPSTDALGPDIELEIEKTAQRLEAVVITFSDTVRKPPLCAAMRDRLVKAWGPPVENRWDALARDRAVEFTTLDPPSCTLRFFRTVPPKQWLSMSRRSVVPVWAIGKSVTELASALAPLQPTEQDPQYYAPSLHWQDTSIAGDKMWLTAYHARGRVIGIEVELDVDPGLRAWQRIKAVFGAPGPAKVKDDSQSWRWRRSPGIVLDNWVGDLPVPAPGRPVGTQDMHPKEPSAYTHSTIVFGVKPASP